MTLKTRGLSDLLKRTRCVRGCADPSLTRGIRPAYTVLVSPVFVPGQKALDGSSLDECMGGGAAL